MNEAAPIAPARGLSAGRALTYAIGGYLLAQVAAGVLGAVVTGGSFDADKLSLATVLLLQVPLWLGMLAVALWVSNRHGKGPVEELGLRASWSDLPVGAGWGVLTQLLFVPLLYWPLIKLFDIDQSKFDDPARRLTDKAVGPIGVVLLIVIVAVGAPIVEEIFYRGMLQRALVRSLPAPVAIGITATLFGVSHFELLQLPALILFGLVAGTLAHRCGRIGPSIVCHVAFNSIAVISLLAR